MENKTDLIVGALVLSVGLWLLLKKKKPINTLTGAETGAEGGEALGVTSDTESTPGFLASAAAGAGVM